ncbi:MAG: hypothetical protein M3N19_00985 [Candidatus Eremiobacteraeota bacterium]|nr:hypothetical protein [Candidatus Eremiobacteraeota bacterium]
MTDQTIDYIYIITDTKGAGRVVGAFADRDRAESVRGVDKAYFRLTTLPLNSVNPVAIEWLLSTAQRDELRNL